MQAILKAIITVSCLSTGVAVAAPEVQTIERAGSLFLANPEVAQQLLDVAHDSQRTLYIDRIVTTSLASSLPVSSSTAVCVQISWDGGDTRSEWGAITGQVTARIVGRGVVIEVSDVAFESVDESGVKGRCAR